MNVSIYSRSEIKKLIFKGFPKNTAVISYYGEYEQPVSFPSWIPHIRLFIDDIDISEIKGSEDYHIEDFRRIARFVKSCAEKDMDIICQCEAGISRSAGTAAAIKEFYDHDGKSIFEDSRYNPNRMFYNNLYRCLKEDTDNNHTEGSECQQK